MRSPPLESEGGGEGRGGGEHSTPDEQENNYSGDKNSFFHGDFVDRPSGGPPSETIIRPRAVRFLFLSRGYVVFFYRVSWQGRHPQDCIIKHANIKIKQKEGVGQGLIVDLNANTFRHQVPK